MNFKVEGYDFGILRNKFSLYAFGDFLDGYDVIEIFLFGMYLLLYFCTVDAINKKRFHVKLLPGSPLDPALLFSMGLEINK